MSARLQSAARERTRRGVNLIMRVCSVHEVSVVTAAGTNWNFEFARTAENI